MERELPRCTVSQFIEQEIRPGQGGDEVAVQNAAREVLRDWRSGDTVIMDEAIRESNAPMLREGKEVDEEDNP